MAAVGIGQWTMDSGQSEAVRHGLGLYVCRFTAQVTAQVSGRSVPVVPVVQVCTETCTV